MWPDKHRGSYIISLLSTVPFELLVCKHVHMLFTFADTRQFSTALTVTLRCHPVNLKVRRLNLVLVQIHNVRLFHCVQHIKTDTLKRYSHQLAKQLNVSF